MLKCLHHIHIGRKPLNCLLFNQELRGRRFSFLLLNDNNNDTNTNTNTTRRITLFGSSSRRTFVHPSTVSSEDDEGEGEGEGEDNGSNKRGKPSWTRQDRWD